MKRWKVMFGFRDKDGYREESTYVDGNNISVAAKNATKYLEEKKSGEWCTYMITDIGLMGDPNKEVC